MIPFEKEYKVEDVYREKDSEGKEKYVVLELVNAKDENLLSSSNILIGSSKTIIRKN